MNTNTLYKNFVKDTGLTDAIFDSVFKKLSDFSDRISNLKWVSVKQSDPNEILTYVFSEIQTIPLYVVEIIRNIFGEYFTLPKGVVVELKLMYYGKEYSIVSDAEGTVIPSELLFLKEDGVFDMFCSMKPVYDIFGEFNDIFSFTNNFSAKPNKVFFALEKKFDGTVARDEVVNGEHTEDQIAKKQESLILLQDSLENTLRKIEAIKNEREQITTKLNRVQSGIASRNSITERKAVLTADLETLTNTWESQSERLDNLNTLLMEIDTELTDINSHRPDSPDKQFYLEKKEVFTAERSAISDAFNKTEQFISTVKMELNTVSSMLKELDDYDMSDFSTSQNRVEELNKEQNELNDVVLNLENQIKQTERSIVASQEKSAESRYVGSESINIIESSSIKDHICQPLQPRPVTAVVNYLRYLYAYQTTKQSKELIDGNENVDPYMIQAIVSKIVLSEFFGFKFDCVFTSLSFSNESINHTITVVKE